MAKEDFCFTYYDGDAAHDMAHMNRIERGAYVDLISAQRKFGHLTKKFIEKVLSSDFEKCWESLEMILKKDADEKYFIEWLDKSLKKSKEHSEIQKKKIQDYWDKKKNSNTEPIPQYDNGIDLVIPLGYGNGNGDGNVNSIVIRNVNEEKRVFKILNWFSEIKTDQILLESFCSMSTCQPEDFNTALRRFFEDKKATEDWESVKKMKEHFLQWSKFYKTIKSKSNEFTGIKQRENVSAWEQATRESIERLTGRKYDPQSNQLTPIEKP